MAECAFACLSPSGLAVRVRSAPGQVHACACEPVGEGVALNPASKVMSGCQVSALWGLARSCRWIAWDSVGTGAVFIENIINAFCQEPEAHSGVPRCLT